MKTKDIRNQNPARNKRQLVFYCQSTKNARVLDVDIHVTTAMTLYVRCHYAHSGRRSGVSLEEVIRRSTCSRLSTRDYAIVI